MVHFLAAGDQRFAASEKTPEVGHQLVRVLDRFEAVDDQKVAVLAKELRHAYQLFFGPLSCNFPVIELAGRRIQEGLEVECRFIDSDDSFTGKLLLCGAVTGRFFEEVLLEGASGQFQGKSGFTGPSQPVDNDSGRSQGIA